ncbi:MAG: hypothetical protein MJA83_18450 [Gammaproteobacteria bacterium]|nr:hypothetical protein [Gammaproteobacteria bacterium]
MTVEDAIELVENGKDPRDIVEFIMTDVGRSTSAQVGSTKNELPKTDSNNMEVPPKSSRMKSTDKLSFGQSPEKGKLKDIVNRDVANNQGTDDFPYMNTGAETGRDSIP